MTVKRVIARQSMDLRAIRDLVLVVWSVAGSGSVAVSLMQWNL